MKLISEVFCQKKESKVSYALIDDESAVEFLTKNQTEVENKIMENFKKQRISELQNELNLLIK